MYITLTLSLACLGIEQEQIRPFVWPFYTLCEEHENWHSTNLYQKAPVKNGSPYEFALGPPGGDKI